MINKYILAFYFWISVSQCDYVENRRCHLFAWFNELSFEKRKILPGISLDFSDAFTWWGEEVFSSIIRMSKRVHWNVILPRLLYPMEGESLRLPQALWNPWVKESPTSSFWGVKSDARLCVSHCQPPPHSAQWPASDPSRLGVHSTPPSIRPAGKRQGCEGLREAGRLASPANPPPGRRADVLCRCPSVLGFDPSEMISPADRL